MSVQDGFEELGLEPAGPNGMLAIRDRLRDTFASIGLDGIQVNAASVRGRRSLVIDTNALSTARDLLRVLETCDEARRQTPALGAVVWCPITRRVGEVIGNQHRRLKLRALANDEEWTADPTKIQPARLVDIDAARRAREHRTGRGARW